MIQYVLLIFIAIAFFTDAWRSILPNWLTLGGTLAGVLLQSLESGMEGLFQAVIGAVVGFGMLLLLHLIGALGAGDVKLFAAIGALTGALFVIQCLLYSILFAGIIGLLLLLIRKKLLTTGSRIANWLFTITMNRDLQTLLRLKQQPNLKFPFMYAVVPGVCTAWYYALIP
ncbi:prepilin peptidase [Paenibacillus hexagrammi]|uniref:A24 family peptidase n=1 Tax=Paenibacillus hexagrammi TaxID=2908839 RepID=A0ABY3SS58_9BACL|nr:A24 family peptidase [Paenibacillus sp. YPD9-1]UJF35950.1 A24 family peptidase [Paenibacillus sp. YPD9-1]